MPVQVLLRPGLRVETRVRYPGRRCSGEKVRDLDVILREGALWVLAVDHECADQLALEEERKREDLREALGLDQRVIADAPGRHVQDDVLARRAKLRPHLVDRKALSGRVALRKS